MKKIYMKPMVEVMAVEIRSFLTASKDPATGRKQNGLDMPIDVEETNGDKDGMTNGQGGFIRSKGGIIWDEDE